MSLIDTPTRTTDIPAAEQLRPNRLFTTAALLAIIVGLGAILGGITGATFTYQQAAVENITTPDDAIFPEVPVRGPLSLYAQSDIITQHQLDATGGQRYAEMDRVVPMVDETGEVVLDDNGDAVMVPNDARNSWINATALTTVLNLGLMAYALSAFAIVVGATLTAIGLALYRLRNATIL